MTVTLTIVLCVTMVATSFLSGMFGMAGGLVLIGVLLAIMPVPDAMMLHGVTQMASNGWRGLLWIKHVRWNAAGSYVLGCVVALLLWSFVRYVPSKPIAFLLLGLTPFMARLVPDELRPNPERLVQGAIYGAVCMTLILMTGVAGPLVDSFFLGGKLDRREIIASKAICQIFAHGAKLAYFGMIVEQTASLDPWLAVMAIALSVVGTTLAGRVLQAMSDTQFRTWAGRIITVIAGYYVAHGTVLAVLAAYG